MARRALKQINRKLKSLYRQAIFLNPACKRLLCDALIQPHFDYGCTSWYPLLSKALKKRFQIAQNKCLRYCLDLSLCTHISAMHFNKINWLPVEHRVELCATATVFKFWNQLTPSYFLKIFQHSLLINATLDHRWHQIYLFEKLQIGQKSHFWDPKYGPKQAIV